MGLLFCDRFKTKGGYKRRKNKDDFFKFLILVNRMV